MRRGRTLLALGAVAAATAVPLIPAGATSPQAPAHLPVAWRASSTNNASFNAPALTPYGVATTAGSTVATRDLAHGKVIWSKLLPQSPTDPGRRYGGGNPVFANGIIDTVIYGTAAEGIADFDAANGSSTVSGAGMHALYSQLAVSGTRTARLHGGYGSNAGSSYELDWGGRTWFVDFDLNYGPTPVPALIGTRVFSPTYGAPGVESFDPAAPCHQIPTVPTWCLPTWRTDFTSAPTTPVAAGPDLIATSDASGVVTWLTARTGLAILRTGSMHTPLAPPAAANGVVYVGGADGVVRALKSSGSGGWSGDAGAPVTTAPMVSGGRVYVATDNGRLVTFNAAGCGKPTCAPLAVGTTGLSGTHAAGAPVVRNHIAIAAYGTQLVAFAV